MLSEMRSRLINALFNRPPFIARLDLNCGATGIVVVLDVARTIILNSACDERSRPARGNRTLIFYGVILACKKDEIEERDFFLTTFLLE